MVDVGKVSGGTYFQKPQNETNTQQEQSLISIFNSNNDNTFSVQEQKNAYNSEIDKYCKSNGNLLKIYNFNLENFKTKIFENLKDQDISDPNVRDVIESNILNVQKQIFESIRDKQSTSVGKGWGRDAMHLDYIFTEKIME